MGNPYDNLPAELRETGLFNVRRNKRPYNPNTGYGCDPGNPEHFTDYHTALEVLTRGNYDGLGIGIFGDLVAIDLDHVVKDGVVINPDAQHFIDLMDCYTEYSPSGTGVRLIAKASGFRFDAVKYYFNNHARGFEVYVGGATIRYVTITGNVIHPGDLVERGEQLQTALDLYMVRPTSTIPTGSATLPLPGGGSSGLTDNELIEKALAAANGAKFAALWDGNWEKAGYPSQSEADLALLDQLAWWSNNDPEQIDRLFRASGLCETEERIAKWNRLASEQIAKAIASNPTGGYHPGRLVRLSRQSAQEDFAQTGITPAIEVLYDLNDVQPDQTYDWDDAGASLLFAHLHASVLKYVTEAGSWYYYTGVNWKKDLKSLQARKYCRQLATKILIYALHIGDDELRERYLKFANRWSGKTFRFAVVDDAQDVNPISLAKFDVHRNVMNCPNVTLWFHDDGTFVAKPHDPEDLLTKVAGAIYDPSAADPRWDQFIDEVMSGSRADAEYLQKALGYSLTGDTSLECLFILYGATTRNGKSTLTDAALGVQGEYGKSAKPELLGLKPNHNNDGDKATPGLSKMPGTHYAIISEPGKNLTLDGAIIKGFTGNDKITARPLFENEFEFYPQFKIYINTNYLPDVNDPTLFTSGRIRIITFQRHFTEAEQDKTLKSHFAKPRVQSAILNWLLAGWVKLKADGLAPTEAVAAAVNDHQRESDPIGRFIEEVLKDDLYYNERTSLAFNAHKEWCAIEGVVAVRSVRSLNKALRTAGLIVTEGTATDNGRWTTVILGRRLIEEFRPQTEPADEFGDH